MRKSIFKAVLLISAILFVSCRKIDFFKDDAASSTRYYANLFAYNIMSGYYLWNEEIGSQLSKWALTDDPVQTVEAIRYKEADGTPVDRWTALMEDYSSFLQTVTGNGKTYGFEFVLQYTDASRNNICAIVTFTYENSPASKAGLKRGDVILYVDGTAMTPDNYYDMLSEKIYDNPTSIKLGLYGGDTISMTATDMYSNPVNVVKTLDAGGKKTGYLHFSGFTREAAGDLIEAFRTFKEEEIEELILDLRYNNGGYNTTCQILASMIAPISVVQDGAIFNKSIYNKDLQDEMEEDECFALEYTFKEDGEDVTYKPGEVNISLPRLWVIATGHSASASESLICGLKPYMDVTLVGSTTYGKFCGGYLISASSWYTAVKESEKVTIDAQDGLEKTAGWGIYVIASRYADCNGVTLSMPSGIPADVEVRDAPRDGYELGDPEETMLAATLSLIEGKPATASYGKRLAGEVETIPFEKPGSGALIW